MYVQFPTFLDQLVGVVERAEHEFVDSNDSDQCRRLEHRYYADRVGPDTRSVGCDGTLR